MGVSVTLKFSSRIGADPFFKIKNLISGMIDKLQSEAASEATEKSYCDEEMEKTEAKKSDLDDTTAKATSQIDKAVARSATLKEDVSELQTELADLSRSQAQMDKMRQEEKADYTVAKE